MPVCHIHNIMMDAPLGRGRGRFGWLHRVFPCIDQLCDPIIKMFECIYMRTYIYIYVFVCTCIQKICMRIYIYILQEFLCIYMTYENTSLRVCMSMRKHQNKLPDCSARISLCCTDLIICVAAMFGPKLRSKADKSSQLNLLPLNDSCCCCVLQ